MLALQRLSKTLAQAPVSPASRLTLVLRRSTAAAALKAVSPACTCSPCRPPVTSGWSSGDSSHGCTGGPAASLERPLSWPPRFSDRSSPGLPCHPVSVATPPFVCYRLPTSLFLVGHPGPPVATRGSTRGWSPHPPAGLHFFPGLFGGL